MGKRKKSSRKPAGPKKRESLATTFTCLFCNHEDAVTVKMDKKQGIGDLRCSTCHKNFQTSINYLSAPVDVFSDWIDACEAVAQEDLAAQEEQVTEADKQFSSYANERPRATARAGSDDGEGGGYGDDDDDY